MLNFLYRIRKNWSSPKEGEESAAKSTSSEEKDYSSSNLPFLAKVVEKVAAKRLMTHLQDNDLHEAMQSAYKQLHSVETALLRISDDILRAVDNKKAVIIILLDLSAAFDTIDHEVLLQRLHVDFKVDATALAWFRSYLHCRRQMVNINGTLSEEALLKYGVPQGSVLGPLLFTLYIAPLGEIARHHGLQVHFYADDTQLYVTFDPGVRDEDADAISRLTTCLAEIRQWMVLNFVKLNDDKTEYLVISSPHMQNKIVPQNLQVGCVSVPPSENARNLGVFFDQCMKMYKHISKVCQATYYQLRNISAIRSLLTRSAAESLIHSLVTSRIDFCNSLLVGLPSAMLNRLQGVQNAAARLLTGTKKYDHITPILTELHWLPIKYRIEFKILLLTFKAVHGLAPGYVTSLIEQRRLRPGLRSSGTGITLHVPITHLRGYGDRAFSSIAPRLWNSLPSSLREIDSIDLFKSSLKTHLFQQMCNNWLNWMSLRLWMFLTEVWRNINAVDHHHHHHLQEVVNTLRDKNLLSPNGAEMLSKTFSDVPADVMNRIVANKSSGKLSRKSYPPALRAFALTLHFYSAIAYKYTCEKMLWLFPVGDWVWLSGISTKRNVCPKLVFKWDGPFLITHKLSDVVFCIQKNGRSRSMSNIWFLVSVSHNCCQITLQLLPHLQPNLGHQGNLYDTMIGNSLHIYSLTFAILDI